MKSSFTISAVGDLAFAGHKSDNPSLQTFENIRSIWQDSRIIVGNLEGPLTQKGESVAGKCTLRGNTDWSIVLKQAGFNLLILANNHVMDFGPEGLMETMECLKKADMPFVGVGPNQEKACAPFLLSTGRKRIAFLARSSVVVSSPCYAGDSTPGVARLDMHETLRAIRSCKQQADLVILFIHWGLEHYAYPSPEQRRQAKVLIEGGTDAIIGHHPHVLQGIEWIDSAPVAYSLGNFLFDDFKWTYSQPGQEARSFFFTLSPQERMGMILNLTWKDRGRPQTAIHFTKISSEAAVVEDLSESRRSHFEGLCRKLTIPSYDLWWRLYAMRKECGLRIFPQISPGMIVRNFWKLRPHHLKRFLSTIRRSGRIAAEKSTNPYEN